MMFPYSWPNYSNFEMSLLNQLDWRVPIKSFNNSRQIKISNVNKKNIKKEKQKTKLKNKQKIEKKIKIKIK